LDIIPEEYRELIVRYSQSVLEENKPTGMEKKIRRFDDTLVEVETICTPVIYKGKIAIQSFVREITQRKETERALEKVSKELNSLSAPVLDFKKESL
jgi:rsbT co-antagonist protein RsbR